LADVVRGFRDRDYLETRDNLFFAVIGNVHPEDCVVAYLKYLPNPHGKWKRRGTRYARSTRYYSAENIMKTVEFLAKRYPQYVFRYESSDMVFSAVPHETIATHYRPEKRLEELRNANHMDHLERRAIQLASLLSDRTGVPLGRLGVTGSILLDIHTAFSDIDLTAYGVNESRKIKENLLSLYERNGTPIHRFAGRALTKWCKEQSSVHPLTVREAEALYARTWNKGIFENTVFSIHPVKVEQEVQFDKELYKSKGLVEVSARVVDSSDSCFLPATYLVADVRPEEGFNNVTKVVSYEGLYGDIAGKDDWITVRGKLEEAFDQSGRLRYRRILVGSPEACGSDFIKVI
jgi:predicted nucleotidyltransferase